MDCAKMISIIKCAQSTRDGCLQAATNCGWIILHIRIPQTKPRNELPNECHYYTHYRFEVVNNSKSSSVGIMIIRSAQLVCCFQLRTCFCTDQTDETQFNCIGDPRKDIETKCIWLTNIAMGNCIHDVVLIKDISNKHEWSTQKKNETKQYVI